MATTVSKPFYSSLVRHGEDHHEVTLVTNDLTASCEADGFRDAFPDRYVSAGMAEQALVASLSGMAAVVRFKPLLDWELKWVYCCLNNKAA